MRFLVPVVLYILGHAGVFSVETRDVNSHGKCMNTNEAAGRPIISPYAAGVFFCRMIRGIHRSGHIFFHVSYWAIVLVLSMQPAQVSKDLTMKEVLSRTRNDSSAAAKCLDHRQLKISCGNFPTG